MFGWFLSASSRQRRSETPRAGFGEAAAQGFVHDFAGLLMFAVALLTIFTIDQLAGDLLPKDGGHKAQKEFFPKLRRHLQDVNKAASLTVYLYFGNDDHHILELLSQGKLDPAPLVTHHMTLDQAPDAYRAYDNREALKIVLSP